MIDNNFTKMIKSKYRLILKYKQLEIVEVTDENGAVVYSATHGNRRKTDSSLFRLCRSLGFALVGIAKVDIDGEEPYYIMNATPSTNVRFAGGAIIRHFREVGIDYRPRKGNTQYTNCKVSAKHYLTEAKRAFDVFVNERIPNIDAYGGFANGSVKEKEFFYEVSRS